MSKKNIIYILPHFDDEIFVIPKITRDIKDGHNLKFYFLMKSHERIKESKNFLHTLGVKSSDIESVGDKLNIFDGTIHLHLDKLFQELFSKLNEQQQISEFVCTAYEGGHQDHDAASLLTRSLALKFQSRVLEYYLYNGSGKRGKLYNVAFPINLIKPLFINYSLGNLMSLSKVPLFYRSQAKAMLGLLPFLLFKAVFFRKLILNSLEFNQLNIHDHLTTPMYERWNRITLDEFKMANKNFIKMHSIQP